MPLSGSPTIPTPDPDPSPEVFSAAEVAPRGALILKVRLDLDVATESAAREELVRRVEGARGPVVVDLTDRFMGVSGIRVLLAAGATADRRGAPFAVVGAPRWLRELAPALEIDDQLPFHPTVACALRALTGEPSAPGAGQDGDPTPDGRERSDGRAPAPVRYERLVLVRDGSLAGVDGSPDGADGALDDPLDRLSHTPPDGRDWPGRVRARREGSPTKWR